MYMLSLLLCWTTQLIKSLHTNLELHLDVLDHDAYHIDGVGKAGSIFSL